MGIKAEMFATRQHGPGGKLIAPEQAGEYHGHSQAAES